MVPNPPLSASASKPISLGVATAQQLLVAILDSELILCGCRASCREPCKFLKANSACSGLCNCGGNF